MTRRAALAVVSALIGYVNGRTDQTGRIITLPLDGVDAIVLPYRGQRIVLHPQELIDALKGK